MKLRAAAPGDAAEIASIWNEGWREAHLGRVPDELVRHRRLEDHLRQVPVLLPGITVAEAEGRVAGFVAVVEDEIEEVYVDPAFRGGEVAAALLDAAEEHVARHFDRAWLAVLADNPRARRFYERRGWKDTGPFDNPAWTPDGARIPVPCRRYEKSVRD